VPCDPGYNGGGNPLYTIEIKRFCNWDIFARYSFLLFISKTKLISRKEKQSVCFVTAAFLLAVGADAQDVKGQNFFNTGPATGSFGFTGTGGEPYLLPCSATFFPFFNIPINNRPCACNAFRA